MISALSSRFLPPLLFLCVGLSFLRVGFAAEPSYSDSFRAWGATGYTSSSLMDRNYGGAKVVGGIRFPSLTSPRQSIRASLSHSIDRAPLSRSGFLFHIGYRFADPLEVALLGGIGILKRESPDQTYLKPLIGIEIVSLLFPNRSRDLSAFLSYEVYQGATGSIALDGGPADLATKTLTLGIAVSFELFNEGSPE